MEKKSIILGNIYGYINDKLIDLYFTNDKNLTETQKIELEKKVNNILNLFLNYLNRINDNSQVLNTKETLKFFK